MYRALKVTATGQWCGPLLGPGEFADDGTAWAAAVAETLSSGPLTVVDSDTDPRTGTLLEDPNVAPPPIPQPDVNSAELAIFGAIGVAAMTSAPLAYFVAPFNAALDKGNWAVASQLLDAAEQAGALTPTQRTQIADACAANNVPVS